MKLVLSVSALCVGLVTGWVLLNVRFLGVERTLREHATRATLNCFDAVFRSRNPGLAPVAELSLT